MSYFKKSHQHKPKKGKGSYARKEEAEVDWPDLSFPPVNLLVLPSAHNFYEDTDTCESCGGVLKWEDEKSKHMCHTCSIPNPLDYEDWW